MTIPWIIAIVGGLTLLAFVAELTPARRVSRLLLHGFGPAWSETRSARANHLGMAAWSAKWFAAFGVLAAVIGYFTFNPLDPEPNVLALGAFFLCMFLALMAFAATLIGLFRAIFPGK